MIHFLFFLLPGGFYSDQLGFVSDKCRRCEEGKFVHYNNAPGKSQYDCRTCPEGDYLNLIPSVKEP